MHRCFCQICSVILLLSLLDLRHFISVLHSHCTATGMNTMPAIVLPEIVCLILVPGENDLKKEEVQTQFKNHAPNTNG